MFPYPSGAGLHGGHVKNYVPTDAFCRYKVMRGFKVLYATGWDAFGQPAENEAIKRGRNPRQMVAEYASNFRRAMKRLGLSYDWDREINTSDPGFYKWTQWFFLLLHERGLAYRATAMINWCPSCKTGLANEEVKESRCWRCDTLIEKRPMPQWYFKITDYARRLEKDLDTIDWPTGVKQMQREWIGRSEGAEVEFRLRDRTEAIRVFTTRPDTLFGATFLVLAPEHPLVPVITEPSRRPEVDAYVHRAQQRTEIERMSPERAKSGVFTGTFAVNPVNDEAVPVWVGDYVLMGYGTGAIMAVPAHDQRDFEFARRYGLPIRMVYRSPDGPATEADMTQALPDGGLLVNSGPFNGLPNSQETRNRFATWLGATGKGAPKTTYKIRDWLISRQRYWGAPIPIVHCAHCGEVPVPKEQLPVLLPEVENYQPSGTGESPLAMIKEFVETCCPRCGGAARRETDTMGGFACSSWYFLRFADPHNDAEFASRSKLDYWLPVDMYTGGTEHAVMHLLYARFWTKVMYDADLVGFSEPFCTLRNQGTMLAYTPGRRPRTDELAAGDDDDDQVIDWIVLKPEERQSFPEDQVVWRWAKMSKSKGNGIQPEEIVDRHGADSLRLYVMFVAPFEDNVQWSEEGLRGASRFIHRLWRWVTAALPSFNPAWATELPKTAFRAEDVAVRRKLHQTVRKVSDDIENFRFNTAVAALMELINVLYAYRPAEGAEKGPAVVANPLVTSEAIQHLALLLAPLTPHLAEELWSRLGMNGSVCRARWPDSDETAAAEVQITVVVQHNGKVRDRLLVSADAPDETLKQLALSAEKIVSALNGKTIRNVIVVPRKLVNVVTD
jgi:leucyl-tRNA synthetase